MTISASLIAAEVMEWLHGDAVRLGEALDLVEALAGRLNAAGVPVDRITTGISILHPNVRAESVLWSSDGEREMRSFRETPENEIAYEHSPLKVVYTENRKVRINLLANEPLPAYGVVEDLQTGRYTDYVALPMPFSDGSIKGVTFATRHPEGFTSAQISLFEALARPLGLLCELQTLKRTARTLLETYVGRRAGRRVLEGTIKRGDGETISAVVGFTDLRGFTRLSNELPGKKLIGLLNAYFSAVTEAVEAHGGEVLKFIGDEVMTVFPYGCEETARAAARRALLAARDAVQTIRTINRQCCDASSPELRVGIALHAGDVFFGNVGGKSRLDFTVVGPVVNLAARLAGLTRELKQDILVSEQIAEIMGCRHGLLGSYQLKGFDEPTLVFTPPLAAIGGDGNWCADAAMDLALDTN
ncbi:adenylate/guanylate cyclase domain-containing protein [Stappia indica]|uniref:adenylate/guanylate cyclase domain-containing protein n=1 Tax=Stappia indica TaxID=538381 RepID=UPI001CD4584C|nr:adenylate/guanylate cyclase domain-containing protein [Stappia indica]MCA1300362.1 adenylate/guanylate cyclase domain-containing protein [Stappia indica]